MTDRVSKHLSNAKINDDQYQYVVSLLQKRAKYDEIATSLSIRLGIPISKINVSDTIQRWRAEKREEIIDLAQDEVAPKIVDDLSKVHIVIELLATKTVQYINEDRAKDANNYARTLLSFIEYRASIMGIGIKGSHGNPQDYTDNLKLALEQIRTATENAKHNSSGN